MTEKIKIKIAVRNVREKQNHKMADKLSEKYQNQKMTDRNVREMSEPKNGREKY